MPIKPDPSELQYLDVTPEQIETAKFMRGTGCAYCQHTGYRGRKAVFELMTMTTAIREMTFKGEPNQNIRRQAQMMGMKTIVQDALEKALKGVTTIQEVLMLHRGGH